MKVTFYIPQTFNGKFPVIPSAKKLGITGNFIAVISNFSSGSIKNKAKMAMRRHSTIEVRSLSAPSFVTGVDFSDHRNFWKFGYDAIMITDTAFFRNKNYHKKTDTIETLNFGKMAQLVRGVAGFLIEHAHTID